MKDTELTIQNVFSGLVKVNHKMIQNYLDNFSGYNHDIRDIFLTYFHFLSKFAVSSEELTKVQNYYSEFLDKQYRIWETTLLESHNGKDPVILPSKGDKRFIAPEWDEYPYFNFIKQSYLLAEKFNAKIVADAGINEKSQNKLNFYSSQFSGLFSPANFLLTNPEALSLAYKTRGKSLWNGFNNFITDLEKGKITQTEETAFTVGKNLAITPGGVIYQNELIQIIQYHPSTEKAFEIPLLIIPPWINKYYVLDLQPENSFVKFMIDNGFSVFIISWKNPKPEMGYLTFGDYVEKGALKAIEIVREISGSEKINTLGYCLGGTLLSIAASILAFQKKQVINTITFLAAMVDFTDIGPIGSIIDRALVNKLKRGELLHDGVLHGHDMERAFNLMRVNDLVWNYAVNNYLKGLQPKPFDVLYWTNDNTNLPANMYIYYMEQMILNNKLSRKNALRILDIPIDIGKIDAPVYVIAFKEDYISPPATVFTTTELVNGPVEFILGESGHVMGAINPPSKKKYGHYFGGKLGYGYSDWQKTSNFSEISWWIVWSEKLMKQSGTKILIPKKIGNKKYNVIEPAPGSYVTEECLKSK